MNAVLWILQVSLAVVFFAGGAYKTFMFDELAAAMNGMPHGGWRALGVLEMLGGILLVAPAATGWMPQLTPLAATVLALEALALAAFYANYSLVVAAANPMVWAVVMGVLAAAVAYGRFAPAQAV